MSIWQSVLLAIGGNAALLAIMGYLAKAVFDGMLARDTKRFEAELKAKSDSAIERLKSDLQLRTIEHQVRFSRLHEKRATAIAELYSLLIEALWEAESFLSPVEFVGEPSKHEKNATARNKLVDLYRHFDKHRIYLPVEQCNALQELISTVRTHVISYGNWLPYDGESLPDHARKEQHETWQRGWDAIRNQIPKARESLEAEFRALLGASG